MRRLTGDYADTFLEAGVLGQKAVIRMRDAKLLTEVSSAYWNGITTTNKTSLDRIYREHDKDGDFPEEEDLDGRLRAGLEQLFAWDELYQTDLMKPYEVYSLLLAIMHFQEPLETLQATFELDAEPERADERAILVNLTRLADALDEADHGSLRPFIDASSSRTNVASQRTERFKWFCRALADDLPE
jgi:hypothetical protein